MTLDLYDKTVLLQAVRQMEPVPTFLRSMFFPTTITFTSQKVMMDIVKGNRKLAPFVSPIIGGVIQKMKGYETVEFEPPLVAPDILTSADDLLKRLPGENPFEMMSPEDRARQLQAQEILKLDDSIARREEWMCAQLLFKGEIEVKGEGVDYLIEFDFTNKLDASVNWGGAGSDILGDIETAYRKVQKEGFTRPEILLLDEKAANAFLEDETVLKKLDTKNYNMGYIRPQEINGATYLGKLEFPNLEIWTYNAYYEDDQGDTLTYLPENTALLAPKGSGKMLYGAVPLADQDEKEIFLVEGARVPDIWIEKRPPRKMMNLSAKPLPVIGNVNSWAVINTKPTA